MSTERSVHRLRLALGVLIALVVALLAGILARANNTTVPGAILYGGGAFGVAMSLALAILESLERP
ncbi:hypothetical protein I6A60_23325 [Frankia sp. AgB1.9]|uniref:hypothetical protein n=1 Tax=unclassified Frankia TaxID=2632575 RepID=UPI0019325B58|nr:MULTISPECIES: hypothetical protein [unclassified Frankia]MBL7491674.1 hypothetical protein [Frankia sp. AgW1.1]MBL7550779.1 hypothetical protein [Frankia sp. AgB1.9]MBL7622610.1 hypothetical protein [Frankia sp. AgB1.8]